MENNTTTVPTVYDIPLLPASITRHIYLTEEFDTPSNYILTCQSILELEEYDQAEIHINSGGGNTSVSALLCNAMAKCKAPITCILENEAHSAASVVFLNGDSFEVMKRYQMLSSLSLYTLI